MLDSKASRYGVRIDGNRIQDVDVAHDLGTPGLPVPVVGNSPDGGQKIGTEKLVRSFALDEGLENRSERLGHYVVGVTDIVRLGAGNKLGRCHMSPEQYIEGGSVAFTHHGHDLRVAVPDSQRRVPAIRTVF